MAKSLLEKDYAAPKRRRKKTSSTPATSGPIAFLKSALGGKSPKAFAKNILASGTVKKNPRVTAVLKDSIAGAVKREHSKIGKKS
jgi:hypothetical protein